MMSDRFYRNYLLAVLGSVLVSILMLCVVELAARSLPSPYKTKFEEIKRPDRQIKTLILGSSHFYFGVNPAHFSVPTLNVANVSQDLKYDLQILKNAVAQHEEISHVVVPLSIFSLYYDLDIDTESWRKYSYRHYLGFTDSSASDRFDPLGYSVFLANQNKLGMIQRIVKDVFGKPIDQDWTSDGWGTAYSKVSTTAALLNTGKIAASRHQRYSAPNGAAMASIEAIAEFCRHKDIRLLLVTPPAFYSYRENIDEARLATIRSVATKTAAAAPGIKYIDYFDNPSFDSYDFADADHLNHRGAEKLSRMIDGVLNSF
jgi:hypothetical protein